MAVKKYKRKACEKDAVGGKLDPMSIDSKVKFKSLRFGQYFHPIKCTSPYVNATDVRGDSMTSDWGGGYAAVGALLFYAGLEFSCAVAYDCLPLVVDSLFFVLELILVCAYACTD